ncbi:MAG: MgtC/SapB family protein [Bacteroidales bacterium]
MENFFDRLPEGVAPFLLITVFSLLIGLSQRRLHLNRDTNYFGTDRTFTLVGLLGYILYLFEPTHFSLFAGGGLVFAVLLSINYVYKIGQFRNYGMTSIVTALITYCMGPLVVLTPTWFYVSVVVIVLLLTEMKSTFVELAQKMNNDEFITLAKFLLISFIILPMLPDEEIIVGIHLTPYRIWLATVIVSGISYVSYLMRQYIFPGSGILASGLIGGLYSSTATISIMARKCRTAPSQQLPDYVTAMFLAVSMMFLRLMIVVALFNTQVFDTLLLPLLLLMVISLFIAGGLYMQSRKTRVKPQKEDREEIQKASDNPLEFKVALIFALLYIVFTFVTHYTLNFAGTKGLTLLSFVSGLGDITPFILNLLEGNFANISIHILAISCLQAVLSNNLVKMFYAMGFSGNRPELRKGLWLGFGILSLFNVALLLWI